MKKPVIISLLALSASLCINACANGLEAVEAADAYDCPAACEASADGLANVGYNAADDTVGGMDPAEVCGHEAILAADSCASCRDAISDTYKVFSQSIGCDCPPARAEEGGETISVITEECESTTVPYDVEGCLEFITQPTHCHLLPQL